MTILAEPNQRRMRMWRVAVTFFCVAVLAEPLTSQTTIEIPREQVDELNVGDAPSFEPDFSSVDSMIRSIEDVARQDWSGVLPQDVIDGGLQDRRILDFSTVSWGMEITGDWSESLSGTGALNVLGGDAVDGDGRQFYALLDTETRRWPFQVFAYEPNSVLQVQRRSFGGPASESMQGVTGIGASTNHLFINDRLIGYATAQGMQDRAILPLEDEYLYTQFESGAVTVDTRDAFYRMTFSATIGEYNSETGSPTGRMARLTGWLCEAEAYSQDPGSCRYDTLEVIENTPPHKRENVNFENPSLSLTFSDSVDLQSLTDNFALHTRSDKNERLPIRGVWMETPTGSVAFNPDKPLRSGAVYAARLNGGETGVRTRDGNKVLEADFEWRFTTMIDLIEQAPKDRSLIEIEVVQVSNEAPLVMAKPTLTRATIDWIMHHDIHPAWQPDSYKMDMVMSPDHPYVVAQYGTISNPKEGLRMFRSSRFGDTDRLHMRDTVNFFGWNPEWEGPISSLKLTLRPFDPYPEPLEKAERAFRHSIENWPVWPDDLVIRYAVVEVDEFADGLPENLGPVVDELVWRTEEYATSIMPLRATHSLSLGMRIGPEKLGPSSNNLDRLEYLMRKELTPALGSDNEVVILIAPESFLGSGLGFSALQRVSDLDRRLAVVAPIDHACAFGDEGAFALTHEIFHTFDFYHNPGEIEEILGEDSNENLVCLTSNSASGYVDDMIEGFRMDSSGLGGWLKSAEHGNAQSRDTLASINWPMVISARQAWIADHEYRTLQERMKDKYDRFGSYILPDSGTRYAQANIQGGPSNIEQPRILSDGFASEDEVLTLFGAISSDGTYFEIDAVGLRALPRAASSGPLTAELLDQDGSILSSVRFGTPTQMDIPYQLNGYFHSHDHNHSNAHNRARSHLVSAALTNDPRARKIIVRRDQTVLAERVTDVLPPTIDLMQDDGPIEVGQQPLNLEWQAEGEGQLRYTVRYSPTGLPPWNILTFRQSDTSLMISPSDLVAGSAPHLRVVVDNGFHHVASDLPVSFARPPVPRQWRDVDPDPRAPLTIIFDTLVDPAIVRESLVLEDVGGNEVPFEVQQSQPSIRLNLLPRPAAPSGAPVQLIAPDGFRDVLGNTLNQVVRMPIARRSEFRP